MTVGEILVLVLVALAIFGGGGWLAHSIFHWSWGLSVLSAPLVLALFFVAIRFWWWD